MEPKAWRARLCDRCIHLFQIIESGDVDSIDPFHENEAALIESEDAGCSICSTLWEKYSDRPPPVRRSRLKWRKRRNDEVSKSRQASQPLREWRCFEGSDRVVISRAERCVGLRFETWDPNEIEPAIHMSCPQEFVLCEVERNERLFRAFEKAIQHDGSGSEASLNLAATILEDCVGLHVDCVRDRQPSSYPSRLLDLQQDKVCLIDTREIPVTGPYASLSHTWGNADIKILTHETLPDFCGGFELNEMPATFRDVIHIVRRLNIPYLWIDCYCIMQSEDFESSEKLAEIAKMGEVYANAILNVGATSAKSPLDGLFVQKASQCGHRPPMIIDLADQSMVKPCTYLLYPTSCGRRHPNSLSSQPIFARAWCTQERFLCPRMLHFMEHGIFWECPSMYSGSERLPTQTYPVQATKKNTPFSLRTGSTNVTREHLNDWDQIVATYSNMKLSRPEKDKLAACGAVAKILAELIGDEYIAGHFRQSLVSSLTWVRSRGNGGRSSVWRAPSWSWASVDCAVSMHGNYENNDESEPEILPLKRVTPENSKLSYWEMTEHPDDKKAREVRRAIEKQQFGPCARLISLNVELVDPSNPYGAMKSAIMTVQGPVTEVEHTTTYSERLREWQSSVRWGDNRIDVTFDDPNEPRRNLIVLLTHTHRGRTYPGGTHRYPLHPTRGPGPLLSGLVLVLFQKGSNGEPDVYRRVGAFRGQYFGGSEHLGRNDYKYPVFQRPEERVVIIV